MKRVDFPDLPPVADLGAGAYISEFYKGLNWDGVSELDPAKITISQQRWLDVCKEFNELPGPGIGGFLWMNSGPSADADVPYRTVCIEDGAFKEIGQAKETTLGSAPVKDADRPLEDVMREASEKAAEKNASRQHAPRLHKSHDMNR